VSCTINWYGSRVKLSGFVPESGNMSTDIHSAMTMTALNVALTH
jgi:hypothetical protein